MADVVTVYNRFGVPLADLPVLITREYRSESTVQVGKGNFSIPINHPKATRENLEYNNIVVVNSDAGVPVWTGLIWTPTVLREGQISVSLRSIEWLFGQRWIDTMEGFSAQSPGRWFDDILRFVQVAGDTIIQDTDIDIDFTGDPTDLLFENISCYDAANDLANRTGFYWGLKAAQPAIGGQLALRPFFNRRAGREFTRTLVQNQTLANVEIQEVGNIVNYLNVIARRDGVSYPLYGIATDAESQARFGFIEDYETNVIVGTEDGAQVYAESELSRRRLPYLRIAGTLTSRPFPVAGDRVPVMLSMSTQYLNRDGVISCRVKTSRYDPNTNTLSVLLEEEPPAEQDNA